MESDSFNDQLDKKAILISPNQGRRYEIGNNSFTFKVTSSISNGQLGVYEIVLAPMAIGVKLHYHRFMDESFIVAKGALTIETLEKISRKKKGLLLLLQGFCLMDSEMTPMKW